MSLELVEAKWKKGLLVGIVKGGMMYVVVFFLPVVVGYLVSQYSEYGLTGYKLPEPTSALFLIAFIGIEIVAEVLMPLIGAIIRVLGRLLAAYIFVNTFSSVELVFNYEGFIVHIYLDITIVVYLIVLISVLDGLVSLIKVIKL